jgi:hypothetical protein
MVGAAGRFDAPHRPETGLNRSIGFVVFVCLLLLAALLRWHAGTRADGLIENEARTCRTLAALYDASAEATQAGAPHPGLRAGFLSGVPDLTPIPGLGTEQISYARDADYMYALATRTTPDAHTSATRQGFIMRAWPLEFGATGDVEFRLADDGILWQCQNLSGRSGTDVGFPPRFLDPGGADQEEPWWIVPLPAHK